MAEPLQTLHVVVYNVNGARKAAPAVVAMLTSTDAPDVLVLNELKTGPAAAAAVQKLLLPAAVAATYELVFNNGDTPHHGVAVFVKRAYGSATVLRTVLPVTAAPPLVPCSDADVGPPPDDALVTKKHCHEGRLIALRVEPAAHPAQPYALVAVYVPNSGRAVTPLPMLSYRLRRWDPDLHQLLHSLLTAFDGRVVLAGDLNVAIGEDDVYAPTRLRRTAGFTPLERSSAQAMWDRLGLVDALRVAHPSPAKHFTYYSRAFDAFAHHAGWRLDYVLFSKAMLPAGARVACHVADSAADRAVSDHMPLHVWLDQDADQDV